MTILEHHRTPDTIAMDTRHLQELGKALQHYCLSLTRSRFDADDLAQETWAKALGYRKFTISPNPEALLLRIAKNTWIDASRRRGSLIRAMERSGAASDPASAAATLEELSGLELTFQALLAHLSPPQRPPGFSAMCWGILPPSPPDSWQPRKEQPKRRCTVHAKP